MGSVPLAEVNGTPLHIRYAAVSSNLFSSSTYKFA